MNDEKWTLQRVLEIGAQMELESFTLYSETAEKANYPGAKKMLQKLAEDEKRHREYFVLALEDPSNIKMRTTKEEIPDLKVTDQLVDVPLDPKADYPQILVYAAKREKETHDFYILIAQKFKGTELSDFLGNFAKEELHHKYLLEKEYDDVVLAEM
jgi:rubrerythrin